MSISAPQTIRMRLYGVLVVVAVAAIAYGAWAYNEKLYRDHVAQTDAALVSIVKNVRRLFLYSPTVDISGSADMMLSSTDSVHNVYIESDVFPRNMEGPNRRAVMTPWGGGMAVTQATSENKGDAFYVYLDGLPKRACKDLLSDNAGATRDPLLLAVGSGPAGSVPPVNITELPVTPGAVQTLCAADKNAIGLEYQLRAGEVAKPPVTYAPAPKPKAHKAEAPKIEEKKAEEKKAPEHKTEDKKPAPKAKTEKTKKAE
ncbi:MAG: type 4 pilus major pilin [Alphaproteobacteria bacterium]|nr:type 4 pilus major pilin [Alphaproteobacteria bacterium]